MVVRWILAPLPMSSPRLIALLLCLACPAEAQVALTLGSRVTGGIDAAGSRSYVFSANAGDEISGDVELIGPEGALQFLNLAGNLVAGVKVRRWYLGGTASRRVGFVAPSAGSYQVRITASGAQAGTYALRLEKLAVAERMRGISVTPKVVSTSERIERLSRDVRQSRADAVRQFWLEAAGKGPLVEPVPANDQDVLVTFLWKANYETYNVLVGWPMACWRADDYYMSHLPDTDVWYKTIQLRRGSRFSYWLTPNFRAGADRVFTDQLDPLNPRVFPEDPAATVDLSSVLDTPGAPDESWVRRKPTARGAIEHKRFTSALLKNERGIAVYTPPGYTASGGPYPLVVIFDGSAYSRSVFIDAPTTFDNLINDGRIRPAVVCFVDSLNRLVDLGFGDEYGEAIVRELMPQLRSTYAISVRPQDVVAGGYSAGGLAASLIAFRHPDVFGNVFSQSGAFRLRAAGDQEPNSIAQMFAGAPRKSVRFYLESGLYENVPSGGLPLHELTLDEGLTASNRHFRDVLIAKGYDVVYRESATSHEIVHWRSTLADALLALLEVK